MKKIITIILALVITPFMLIYVGFVVAFEMSHTTAKSWLSKKEIKA